MSWTSLIGCTMRIQTKKLATVVKDDPKAPFSLATTPGCRVLYFDLQPGQTCHFKVMHWKEVTHSNGSYERKLRRHAWLTKWDKVKKSHDTLIDWCTEREWPLNCMTVISAWWRSNMPFQRLSGWLSGYWTWSRQKVRQLELGTRSGRESHSWPKGPSGPPMVLGDLLVTRCGRESLHPAEWASGPPVEQPWRMRKTQRWRP